MQGNLQLLTALAMFIPVAFAAAGFWAEDFRGVDDAPDLAEDKHVLVTLDSWIVPVEEH